MPCIINELFFSKAIHDALQKRNLRLSQLFIFDGSSGSSSNSLEAGKHYYYPSIFLPYCWIVEMMYSEHVQVDTLAGHYLIVTDRDSQRRPLQKTSSFVSAKEYQ